MPEDLDNIFAEVSAESPDETEGLTIEAEPEGFDLSENDVADNPDGIGDEEISGDDTDGDEPSEEESESRGFDWEAYADQLVPVTVQGETEMVPLSELRNGFMRQSDYTRKTQEAAELRDAATWAQQMQWALQNDPLGTLQAMAEAYGLSGEPEPDPFEDVDEELRPLVDLTRQQQYELAEMRSQLERVREQDLLAEVKAEVISLHDRFGDQFDPEATLRVAAAYSLPLEKAHYMVMAERQTARSANSSAAAAAAAAAANGQKSADEVRRQAKKRTASSTATAKFNASEVAVDEFNDIGELFDIMLSNDNS
jgi:hypothetical protein